MNKAKTESRCCNACARDGETVSATSWCVNCCESLCEGCTKYHHKHKQSSLHKVISIADLEESATVLQNSDIYCIEHPEKKQEAFCHDHSTVCCMTCVMLTHRKCDNIQSVENAAEEKKKSEDSKDLEKSFQEMKKDLVQLVETKVTNIVDCEKRITDINLEINKLFDDFIKHIKLLKDRTLEDVAALEKDILPNLESERDELKCRLNAIDNDVQVLDTNTQYAPPAQYLLAVTKLREQSQILEQYIADKNKSLATVSLNYKPNDCITEMMTSLISFGLVSKSSQKQNVHMLSALFDLVDDVGINDDDITCALLLENEHLLISKTNTKTLVLLDHNHKQLSSLNLAGYAWGIKMVSVTEGGVVERDKSILFFKIDNNKIIEVKKNYVQVTRDFIFCNGECYIGSKNKIIVQDIAHHHIRDISVNGEVGYMAKRDDSSLCYTVCHRPELNCVTLDGKAVFQYTHDKLKRAWGVTVDCAGNIYVCGHDSKNVHQLSHDGQLQRIMFDNLPYEPYCIRFNKDHDIAAIGCDKHVLLYKLQ